MGKLSEGFRANSQRWSAVHAALVAAGGPLDRHELARLLDLAVGRLAVHLTKMKARGMVKRGKARGTWEAVPAKDWPAGRGKHSTSRPGALSPSWRGGAYVNEEGYVLIWQGKGAPMADVRGYVYEHRLVMAAVLGRTLLAEELVHHRDENRQNNAIANLEIVTHAEHKMVHRRVQRSDGLRRRNPGEENVTVNCACGCGRALLRFDNFGRPRRFVTGHNKGNARKA